MEIFLNLDFIIFIYMLSYLPPLTDIEIRFVHIKHNGSL